MWCPEHHEVWRKEFFKVEWEIAQSRPPLVFQNHTLVTEPTIIFLGPSVLIVEFSDNFLNYVVA